MKRRTFLKVLAGGLASLTAPVVALPVLERPMRNVTIRGVAPGSMVAIFNEITREQYWLGTAGHTDMVVELPDGEELPLRFVIRKGSPPHYKPMEIHKEIAALQNGETLVVQQVPDN